MSTETYAASSARGPKGWRGEHRTGVPIGEIAARVTLSASVFILAAVALAGALVMLDYSGVPLAEHWAPLTLLVLGGALYTAMIVVWLHKGKL